MQEVAQTAEVQISTNHVWRCGQKMLRALVSNGVIAEEALGWRGPTRNAMYAVPGTLDAADVDAYVASLGDSTVQPEPRVNGPV